MTDLSSLLARAGPEQPDLTEAEVAALERVSVRTLQKWRQRGVGPRYRKVGLLVRYPVAWYREWREVTGSAGTAAGYGVKATRWPSTPSCAAPRSPPTSAAGST